MSAPDRSIDFLTGENLLKAQKQPSGYYSLLNKVWLKLRVIAVFFVLIISGCVTNQDGLLQLQAMTIMDPSLVTSEANGKVFVRSVSTVFQKNGDRSNHDHFEKAVEDLFRTGGRLADDKAGAEFVLDVDVTNFDFSEQVGKSAAAETSISYRVLNARTDAVIYDRVHATKMVVEGNVADPKASDRAKFGQELANVLMHTLIWGTPFGATSSTSRDDSSRREHKIAANQAIKKNLLEFADEFLTKN